MGWCSRRQSEGGNRGVTSMNTICDVMHALEYGTGRKRIRQFAGHGA